MKNYDTEPSPHMRSACDEAYIYIYIYIYIMGNARNTLSCTNCHVANYEW